MGAVIVAGIVGFVGFLAIVAAIPMWGQRTTRRLWVVGVGIAAIVLAVVFWPRVPSGPGYFIVFNNGTQPIITQVRMEPAAGDAYRLEPQQSGPFDPGWPSGTEVQIFTIDCKLIATSHIEGGYRGIAVKADGSTAIGDLGDVGEGQFQLVRRCPDPEPTSPSA